MNLFILDEDPAAAARAHCDKHVVKMILETAQLLSTAQRILLGDAWANAAGLYKSTHSQHPCAVWVRAERPNYLWAANLLCGLCREYAFRYKRTHATCRLIPALLDAPLKSGGYFPDLSQAPQAMPEIYQIPGEPVKAYRAYYVGAKSGFAKWTHREVPSWFSMRGPT